jgi:hypothetical protein
MQSILYTIHQSTHIKGHAASRRIPTAHISYHTAHGQRALMDLVSPRACGLRMWAARYRSCNQGGASGLVAPPAGGKRSGGGREGGFPPAAAASRENAGRGYAREGEGPPR